MRKTRLALTKTKVSRATLLLRDEPEARSRKKPKFFKDKPEAEAFLRLAQVQQENYGTAALSFSDALRVETIECCEWLQPYGKTIAMRQVLSRPS